MRPLSVLAGLALAACNLPYPAAVATIDAPTGSVDAPSQLADAGPGQIGVDVDNGRFFLRAGPGSVSVAIALSRGAGVDGDVTITVATPPSGVTFDALTIPAGSSNGTLVGRTLDTAATLGRTTVTVMASAGTATASDGLDLDVIGDPGVIDPNFGSNGTLSLPSSGGGLTVIPAGLMAQEDKVVVVLRAPQLGKMGIFAERVLASGAIDTTFATNGVFFDDYSSTNLQPNSGSLVAIAQPDGKIVIVGAASNSAGGSVDPFVLRLSSDGARDPQIAGLTIVDTAPASDTIEAVGIAIDGKIVVAGSAKAQSATQTDALFFRLSGTDGSEDATWGRIITGITANDESFPSLVTLSSGGFVAPYHSCNGSTCSSQGARYSNAGTSVMPPVVGIADAVGVADTSTFMNWGTNKNASEGWPVSIQRSHLDGSADTTFATAGVYETPTDPAQYGTACVAELPSSAGYVAIAATTDASAAIMIDLDHSGAPATNIGGGGVRAIGASFTPNAIAIRTDHRVVVLATTASAATVLKAFYW